jgi:hypothetical protein
MDDPSEYNLEKTPAPEYSFRQRRSPAPWLLAAAVILAGGAAIWFFLTGRQAEQTPPEQPAAATRAAAPPTAAQRPLCEMTSATALPPLDESDAVAGKLVRELSAHPRVTAWLATDNLIRNFTVVVENVASGASPAARLRPLRPSGGFRVTETDEALFLNPRSYERYAPIADAVDSVDAPAAARVCAMLKPRLDEASGELGREGSFDSALERAIVAMLRTPALGENVRLVPKGAAYGFEDEALESLTPAQKHLARMGTRNVRVIQDKLRQIALAIGIPGDRLPQ